MVPAPRDTRRGQACLRARQAPAHTAVRLPASVRTLSSVRSPVPVIFYLCRRNTLLIRTTRQTGIQ